MATLKQIAEYIGVSVSAVSYVLNGRAEEKRISADTQQRILEAVEKFHYKPNMNARKLQSGNKYIPIYVVMWKTHVKPNILERFMRGIEGLKQEIGDFEIIICPYELDNLEAVAKKVNDLGYNGVIFLGINQWEASLLEKCDFDIPAVLFYETLKYHSVVVDDREVSSKTIQYMYECGCRNIAFILPELLRNDLYYNGKQYEVPRLKYMLEKANELEMKVYHTDHLYEYSVRGGMQAMEEVFQLYPELDGVYCYVEIMASGVIQWQNLNRHKLKHWINVVSYGNTDFAENVYPQITTINFPVEKMAEKAIYILQEKIGTKDDTQRHEVVPAHLIIRESCIKYNL